jgi:hypothetical protein
MCDEILRSRRDLEDPNNAWPDDRIGDHQIRALPFYDALGCSVCNLLDVQLQIVVSKLERVGCPMDEDCPLGNEKR